MFINSLGSLGTQTEGGIPTSLSALFQQNFQQNLQQLEQDATSNPQAALQLLQSLPPDEQQALMEALGQQNPQAVASINAAYQQQEQQLLGQTPPQNKLNISGIIQLAQNLGKMIGGSNNQQQQAQPQTGPSDGYEALTTMTV